MLITSVWHSLQQSVSLDVVVDHTPGFTALWTAVVKLAPPAFKPNYESRKVVLTEVVQILNACACGAMRTLFKTLCMRSERVFVDAIPSCGNNEDLPVKILYSNIDFLECDTI